MIPGGGGTQRLPRLVGRQLALGLLLSGDRLTGADAVRLGLAYRGFAPAEFDSGVQQFATASRFHRPRHRGPAAGVGGEHVGPAAMRRDLWWRLGRHY
jgi:enoyl-CoA hydratase/carnithine racemase